MSKKRITNWAHFRFSVIGSLLARPAGKGQLQNELKKLAARHYRHPVTGRQVQFSFSTVERWYYRALNSDNPVGVLGRKVRKDAGRSIALTPRLLTELSAQYALYPHFSYQLHADNLNALVNMQPQLGTAPSYSTVRREMKKRGWYPKKSARLNQSAGRQKAVRRLETREVRSFEAAHAHSLWHLDFHQAHRRVVDSQGRWHTPVVLCVLDDFSRLCCHIQWYLAETTENLFHALMQAFLKWGLPRALMTDNGSAMLATETRNGLMNLSIVHETTLPYSAYQNGKQEAYWGLIEGRLMKMLCHVEPLTLSFLNRATLAWSQIEYNRRRHDEIGTSPMERLLKAQDLSRDCPDSRMLTFAFTAQQRRIQRKSDGTIQLGGVRFEVPSRLRHFDHLYVRYQSWDLSRAYLVDRITGKMLARIYPLDKHKNADGLRKTLQAPAPSLAPVKRSDPIPPLLRKILSDYAASGLPPAYLPKDDKEPIR